MVFAPAHLLAAGLGRLRRPAFDARAATELAKLGLPFFPASRYALAPSALMALANDVIINDRRVILELGSGYSTVLLARICADRGGAGSVITVDANAQWLAIVTAFAERAGVAGRIEPVQAPITAGPDGAPWYDRRAIETALGARKIDLLLVDGPVASSRANAYAREPAIPALAPFLADRCAIVLDDAHRPSHARIAERWGRALGLSFTIHQARGGFACAFRGPAFDPII